VGEFVFLVGVIAAFLRPPICVALEPLLACATLTPAILRANSLAAGCTLSEASKKGPG
jgi:hypothetical protein